MLDEGGIKYDTRQGLGVLPWFAVRRSTALRRINGVEGGGLMNKGNRLGLYGKERCPRCGATKTHQRWTLRVVDFSRDRDFAKDMNPVDGFICPRCNEAFRVSRLESENGLIIDWQTEFECTPNYCPNCGCKVVSE